MKRYVLAFTLGMLLTGFVMYAVSARTISFLPEAKAQSQIEPPARGRACSQAIVAGSFSLALDGEIITGSNTGPYAALGVLTLDGQGGATLVASQSFNGVIAPVTTVLGRYALGNDCAGNLQLSTGARFDIVANNSGREINFLQTNSGNVVQGVAKRQ